MRLSALLFLLLSPWVQAQEIPPALPVQSVELSGFSEGLVTRTAANTIPDNALTEALNVLVDEDQPGVIVRRQGYTQCNATAIGESLSVRGLWDFDANNGTKYQVANSSSSFYEHDGDCVWTLIPGLTQFDRDTDFDCVPYLAKFWCTNGQTVFYWDPTGSPSTHTVSAAPLGTLIDGFRNRIVIGDVASNQSRFYLSGELDGTDWTTGPKSTSPAIIAVGGVNDGNKIRCLMGTYGDAYLIGKEKGISALSGFGQTDFRLREMSREVGCIDDRSVREKNNSLYWLSTRGYERLRGNTIERVSDPIRDLTDSIIASAGNLVEQTDTTQTDFEAGNLAAAGPGATLSATISPANVVAGTFSFVDSSSITFFNSGTFDLTAVSDGTEVRLSTDFPPNTPPTNSELETGLLVPWSCLTTGSGADTKCGITTTGAIAGVYSASFTATCISPGGSDSFYLINSVSGSTITSQSNFMTAGASTTTLDTSSYFGQVAYLHFNASVSGGESSTLYSGTFTVLDTLTFRKSGTTGCGGYRGGLIDSVQVFADQVYHDTGTYTSKIFDTSFSTPIGGVFSATVSSGTGYNLSFKIRSSTSPNNDMWGSYVDISPGSQVDRVQRYWQYVASFSITVTTSTPVLYDATLIGGTTGQFISECMNPGTAISSWDRLGCDFTNFDGSWSIAIATGATCNAATRSTATWNAHTNNNVISINTAPFVAYRLTNGFSIFVPTGNPTAHSCSIAWNEGETRPPLATSVHLDRLHIAYTTNTISGSKNDHMLVLDRNDKWVLWDNLNCYSLNLYKRELHCGSSNADGLTHTLYSGTDDDGSSFISRFRTKAYAFGGPQEKKEFIQFGAELEPEPDTSYDISGAFRYYLDRSTTSVSIGPVDMGEDANHLLWAEMPFSLSNSVIGRYLQLEGEVSGNNKPFIFYKGLLKYRPQRPD